MNDPIVADVEVPTNEAGAPLPEESRPILPVFVYCCVITDAYGEHTVGEGWWRKGGWGKLVTLARRYYGVDARE